MLLAEQLVVGNIWTGTGDIPQAEAIAVADGRVIGIGSEKELTDFIGTETLVTRHSGTILPAFQDGHTHVIEGAMFNVRCNLHDLSLDEALSSVRSYAEGISAHGWVRGGGWSMDDFAREGIDRLVLDDLVDGRLAYLTARDGHSAWVSTAALRFAGVDASTPDPEGGRIERDHNGQPIGILHESAMRLVTQVLPATTEQEWLESFTLGQRYMHSLGITAWQDARIEPDLMRAYRNAERAGLLKSRVALSLAWDRGRGLDQISDLVDLRSELADSRLSAPTVKVFLDGVLENRTAWMLAPYEDTRSQGEPLYTGEKLREIVRACESVGFGLHFHAVGDRAVRAALDACEPRALMRDAKVRHQICHLQVVHPDDIPRFAQLGVIANIQPLWACNDSQMLELCRPGLGDARYQLQYPFRSLRDAGAKLACGSDWRVSTPDPLTQIEVAVTRKPPGDTRTTALHQEESLSVEAAVAGFTCGAAYASGFDDVSGRLVVGASADLVVLDGDLWSTPANEISALSVDSTMFQGTWVYDRFNSDLPQS